METMVMPRVLVDDDHVNKMDGGAHALRWYWWSMMLMSILGLVSMYNIMCIFILQFF